MDVASIAMLHVELFAACSHVCHCGCDLLCPLSHSFIFNPFSGSGKEPVVFDLLGYDLYIDYGDDASGSDYPTNQWSISVALHDFCVLETSSLSYCKTIMVLVRWLGQLAFYLPTSYLKKLCFITFVDRP